MADSDFEQQLVRWRHQLHRFPETGFNEVRTADYVASVLGLLGLEVHRGIGGTGVVASMKVGEGTGVIGLRADMDALAITEDSEGRAHASQSPGCMHACGHDGHMAMVLGAAQLLSQRRDFDGTAEQAARFYAEVIPDSKVGTVYRAPGDYPDGKKGNVLTVEFTVAGIPCIGLNGGPQFKQSEAFSFQIATDDQAETDRLWNAIVGNGGQESACGWCKDRWGLSWQITPRALTDAIADPDPAAAKRAFDAMMEMGKIDIAKIEKARAG